MKVARSLSIDVDVLKLAEEHSRRERVSVSRWIEDAVRERLDREQHHQPERERERERAHAHAPIPKRKAG